MSDLEFDAIIDAKNNLIVRIPEAATDDPLVKPGTRVRHRKGGIYTVIGLGRLEASHEECVIYQGKDGMLWARSLAEFIDGRFTLQEPRP